MEKRGWWVFMIILIVVFGGLIAAALLYYFFVDESRSVKIQCSSDNQCDVGSYCNSDGTCSIINCTSDSDCYGSQSCLNGYCIEKICSTQKDCSSGEMCIDGECIPSGSACSTTLDCNNGAIPCVNGICSMCSTNSDCKNGYCSNGACVNNCDNACGSGQVCVKNTIEVCCDNTGGDCGNHCTSQGTGNCKFCVNSMLTCKQGETFATCTADSDCVSGNCLMNTPLGNVCSYVAAKDCVTNYAPGISNQYACNSGAPYCTNGACNTNPLGSVCGINNTINGGNSASNTCRTANLNTNNPQQNPDVKVPYSYYCVNSICRIEPGFLGETCSVDEDCAYTQSATNSSLARLRCVDSVCSQ